ncbi:MAG: hypothetical protein M1812_004257 [Candelaria pacifica]|nr:MAG: hypothetical protein M1812_004257 [Candelaria pacifica]
MSAVSRLTAALASGSQETTLALANLNFDFSLVKWEAPVEFQALGASFSSKRKRNAEDGTAHITARKLGALFAGDLPDTPHLLNAYGRRVSEIAEKPNFNPRGKMQVDGAFAGHVGADGTSIWAGATSGKGAMSVHLLACMLARIWPEPEAISIWSEIVTARKAILQKRIQEEEFPMAFVAASMIDLSRSQLTEWDASARAWLCTADEANALQQKQLMLILDNVGIPIGSGATILSNVMEAWKDALSTLEKLVSGMGQRVQSGAVLLGLSAWHLYPDMSVLGPKSITVQQKDHLIGPGGLVTIGMQNLSPEREGVNWTMPLAHLRYYGKPVVSTQSLQSDSSRVPFSHLLLVAFGAMISSWDTSLHDNIANEARFIIALSEFLQRKSIDQRPVPAIDQRPIPAIDKRPVPAIDLRPFPANKWAKVMADAASTFLESTGKAREEFAQLIALGHRRCAGFLGDKHMPVFGLTNLHTLLYLLAGEEERIKVLRDLANSRAIKVPGALIRYHHSLNPDLGDIYEFAMLQRQPEAESCEPSSCGRPIRNCPRWLPSYRNTKEYSAAGRISELKAKIGGPCYTYSNEDLESYDDHQYITVKSRSYQHGVPPPTTSPSIFGWLLDSLGRAPTQHPNNPITLRLLYGDPLVAAVYVPTSAWSETSIDLGLNHVTGILKEGQFDIDRLELHLNKPLTIGGQYQDYFKSLSTLTVAANVYSYLDSARVNLAITKTPLARRKWLHDIENGHISRRSAFACVAWFETGSVDIDPVDLTEVVAISTGNSLYISQRLLCDPCSTPSEYALRRVVGNIGNSCIAFLVTPRNPSIREPDFDKWRLVQHAPFDGNLESHFEGTSLHLSLTGYQLPLHYGLHGGRDQVACFVEATVSAYDQGHWIADLDILGIHYVRDRNGLRRVQQTCVFAAPDRSGKGCRCSIGERSDSISLSPMSSVDCWDEYLDPPPNSTVFRAGSNWLARLAATAIGNQMKRNVFVQNPNDHVCWRCSEDIGFQDFLNSVLTFIC